MECRSEGIMNNFYVYMYLRCVASQHGPAGSPYYVGKGKGKRAWDIRAHHVGVPRRPECISIVCQNLTEEDAYAEERRLVIEYGRIDSGTGCLRNRTEGGRGPLRRLCSPDTREKMSKTRTGKSLTHKTIAKLRVAMSQKRSPLSDEHRKTLSVVKKGKPSPRKGSKHSEESILKMREVHQRLAENNRQKSIDNFLDAFYSRIAMKSLRANSVHAFTPAAQPQGNTRTLARPDPFNC